MDLKSPIDISLHDHQNKSLNCNLEVVNPDLDTEAGGNTSLLMCEGMRSIILGVLTTTGNSNPPLASHSSSVEFRYVTKLNIFIFRPFYIFNLELFKI